MIEFTFKADLSQWEWWQVALTLILVIMVLKGKHKEAFAWLRSLIPGAKEKTEGDGKITS